ncbi:MAG: hypothetical protein M1552_05275 [Firmicutes bacterium]|nr:hypothetical protein [Bacillota bacterium]
MESISQAQAMACEMAVSCDCNKCKRCLKVCPAAKRGSCSLSSIIQNGCVGCGKCLAACSRRAISYQDDTALFLADLCRGTPISLLVAPAVHSQFVSPANLFGFLKHSGVRSIYNVLLQAKNVHGRSKKDSLTSNNAGCGGWRDDGEHLAGSSYGL